MTKRSKLGYDFCPLPRKRARAWSTMKHLLGRSLATELFMLNDGKPIEVDGDWRVDLCRQLSIHGRHRGNWCQAMDEAFTLGLLTVGNGCVEIHYQTHTKPTPTADQLNTKATPTNNQIDTHSDLTVENHLKDDSQTDRDRQRQDKTERLSHVPERAQPEPAQVVEIRTALAVGFSWLSDTWYQGLGGPDRDQWKAEYEKIGKWTAAERATIAKHMAQTPYLQKKRGKATPAHIVKYREEFLEGPRTFEFDQKQPVKAPERPEPSYYQPFKFVEGGAS